jgi:uncharacterized peroxidase-related enzyme
VKPDASVIALLLLGVQAVDHAYHLPGGPPKQTTFGASHGVIQQNAIKQRPVARTTAASDANGTSGTTNPVDGDLLSGMSRFPLFESYIILAWLVVFDYCQLSERFLPWGFHWRHIVPHIQLPEGLPGIVSGFAFRPETAKPMRELAEILLRGPSSLSSGEREIIATLVSHRNDCYFCQTSHRAAAAHHLGGNYELVDAVRADYLNAPVSPKLKALLTIAGAVQKGGKSVTSEDVARARTEGATDLEIHDTVLIAVAFCMFNRYVDGLATFTPTDERLYDAMGARMAAEGYLAAK